MTNHEQSIALLSDNIKSVHLLVEQVDKILRKRSRVILKSIADKKFIKRGK